MNSIKTALMVAKRFATSNASTILTVGSVIGFVATVVKTALDTPAAVEDLREHENLARREGRTLSNGRRIQIVGRHYIPTIVMGTFTIGCMVGSEAISLKKQLALAGAYTASEEALKELKAKTLQVVGAEKAQEINEEILKDKLEKDHTMFNRKNMDDVMFVDEETGRPFWSTVEDIRAVVNTLNYRLLHEHWIELNDLYFNLGLAPCRLGENNGWNIEDGEISVDTSSSIVIDGCAYIVMRIDNDLKERKKEW